MASVGAKATTAGQGGGERVHRVPVCLESAAAQIQFAAASTSKIFAGIDVAIDWYFGDSCPSAPGVMRIAFSFTTPERLHEGALAYATPYEGSQIVVFYDRVVGLSKSYYLQVYCLLSYVLAHEITHLLQGVDRHSATGIMKSQFNPADTFPMRHKGLRFDQEDVELIDLGLAARTRKSQ